MDIGKKEDAFYNALLFPPALILFSIIKLGVEKAQRKSRMSSWIRPNADLVQHLLL